MATGWWGGLSDQISSMAKDVLIEGTEEIDDHATALQVEQKRTSELQSQNSVVKVENDTLRTKLSELNDSLHSSELQVNAVSSEYKSLLQDKEEEVKGLKKTIEELNECNRSLLSSSASTTAPANRSHYQHFMQPSSHSNGILLDESEDFTESLYYQQEINRLNTELERSRAECLHLKRESKRTSTPQQHEERSGAVTASAAEDTDSRESFEVRLAQENERHKKELEIRENFHQEEIAAVSRQHDEQVAQLRKDSYATIDTLTATHDKSTAGLQKDHGERIEELEKKIRELEDEGRRLGESLQDSQSELTASRHEVSECRKKVAENEANFKLKLAEKDSEDMDADLSQLHSQLESCRQELAHTREELAQSRIESDEYRLQVEELKGDNSALDQSLLDLNQDHEVILEQLIQQRDGLRSQNQSLLDEVQSKSTDDSEVAKLKAKLENASFTLNEMHMDQAEVQKELDLSKAKLKTVADKYKELLGKHKVAARELEAARDELTALKMSAAALEVPDQLAAGVDQEEVQRLHSANRELHAQINQTQDELMAAKRAIASTAQIEVRVDELLDQLDQSEDKVNHLQQSFDQTLASNKQKDASLNQLEAKNEELAISYSREEASRKELEHHVNELESVIQNHIQTESKLNDRLSQAEKEREDLCQSEARLRDGLSHSEIKLGSLVNSETGLKEQLSQALIQIEDLRKSEASLDVCLRQSRVEVESVTQSENELKLRLTQMEKDFKAQLDQAQVEFNKTFDQTQVDLQSLRQGMTELKGKLRESESLVNAGNQSHSSDVETVQQLGSDNAQLESHVSQLTQEYNECDSKHRVTMKELEAARDELTTLKMSAAALDVPDQLAAGVDQVEVQRLHSANRELQAQMVVYKEKMEEAKHTLSEEQLKFAQSQESLVEFQTRIDQLQESLNQSQTANKQQIVTIDQYEGKHSELELVLTQLRADNSSLNDRLNHSGIEVNTLSQSELQLRGRLDQLKVELSKVSQSEAELKDLLIQSETEIQDLRKAESVVSQSESTHKVNLQTLSADKEQLETELKECRDDLTAALRLEVRLSTVQQLLDVSEARCCDLNDLLKNSQSKNEDILNQLEEKSLQLNKCLVQSAHLEDDIQKYTADCDQLTSQLGECREQLTVAESQLNDAVSVEELEAMNAELRAQLSQSQREARQHLQVAASVVESSLEESDHDHSLVADPIVEELVPDAAGVDGLDSSPDSTTYSSGTEIQELKDQLAELQEILAQKVLLINELQGDGYELPSATTAYSSSSPSLQYLITENERMSLLLTENNTEILELRNLSLSADDTSEMTKESVRKLSAIIKDKEVEIEALKLKNESLMSVLQSGDSANGVDAEVLHKLEAEKQLMSQQLAAYAADRQQLVSTLQTKHQEAVNFHGEAVRLSALLQEKETPQMSAEYSKQKEEEIEALKSRLGKLKESLLEKDKMHEDMQLRLSSQSEALSLAQTECHTLRKQIENLTFELSATRAESEDRGDENDKLRAQLSQQDSLLKTLRSAEHELQRTVKEKEREFTQLSSQVSNSGMTVDAEREKQTQTISTLTLERDTAHLTAQQNFVACQDLQQSLSDAADRASKLEREVDRLRSHLVSIEEGYTADLLQSEEREKELRNRVAVAEERAAHTSTAVQHASMEASREITSLEEQLHSIAAQRDTATLQLSSAQEQCSQYSTQLQNLQLVLEQFQQEKDSMHAAEMRRVTTQLAKSQSVVTELETELSRVQGELDNQVEALEAAQRLTLQLERKEEAMGALREEVTLRENQLREAEERIKRLSTSNESKVEKLLVKNLLINHFSAPASKKAEVLRLIASVLGFTAADKEKAGLGDQPGWIGGLWNRLAHPSSAMPNPDQSFSELFVKFLETESTPKPAPLPLPVDRMVEEERKRAELHHKQAFNPFMAPSAPLTSSMTTSTPISKPQHSFPLIVGSARDSSPLFTNNQPLSIPLSASLQPALSLTPIPTAAVTASAFVPIPISDNTNT